MDANTPTEWHRKRTFALVERYPELQRLTDPNPFTALFVVAVVVAQLAIGAAVKDASWLTVVLLAISIGAVLAHAAAVLIHECTHKLVFTSDVANRLLAIFANVPLVLPGAMDFRDKHLAHHRHLGEGESKDFQTPTDAAIRWVGSSPLRRIVWLMVGSIVFPKRTIHDAELPNHKRWVWANATFQLAAMTGFALAFGLEALAYLALSALFAFGVHPLAMRGFGEHVSGDRAQPTSSYYGLGNLVSFNVGYHVEHHDLPFIPWNRLPEVRRIGAPFYTDLRHHTSWTAMLIAFLRGRSYAIDGYVTATRPKRVQVQWVAGPRGSRVVHGPLR